MSDLSTPQIVGAGALIILVLDRVFNFVKGMKQPHHTANGMAGEKSPDWWEHKFRTIVEDVMDRRNAALRQLVEDAVEKSLRRRKP